MSVAKDELVTLIADVVNKNAGEPAAFFLNDIDNPANITDWISTGSSLLDIAISNRPYGGIPVGRITELTGLEQSGKSLICAHMLANTQKKGGIAILIDTENSASKDFYEAIGLDVDNLVYIQAETIEDVFDHLTSIITLIRAKSKDKLVTICVDSVAGATTKQELESDYDRDGYATGKALILSKAMRKVTNMIGKQRIALVFTNQLRFKMNAMAFGDPYTTPGGKAIGFHASVRVRLNKAKAQLETVDGVKRSYGVAVTAKLQKNRMGPPNTTANFVINFDSGIDDLKSWIDVLKTYKLITGTGRGYTYKDDNGNAHKFVAKTFHKLLDDSPELKEEIYGKICDALIMKYNSVNTRDSEFVEDDVDEIDDD